MRPYLPVFPSSPCTDMHCSIVFSLWCILSLLSVSFAETQTLHFPEAASTSLSSVATTLPYHKNGSVTGFDKKNCTSHARPCSSVYTYHCIVQPLGWGRDDSSQILAAVERCGKDGIITFPAPFVYTIARRMHMKLDNARLEIFGTWSFTPDLLYWIDNSFRIEFQNQSTAWIVEGHNFEIDGGGWAEGGINGNGQAWMTRSQGRSNQFGRPIPLSIYNSTNVKIKNFAVRQPQFWSFWVQDSSCIELKGIYINGTNTDPAGNSSNYEINIDGFNSMRANNLLLEDWSFHGGDDCISPKGNSTNIDIRNVTCVGGGVAFGSVGQYVESPDYITNVTATNISVAEDVNPRTGGATNIGGAYFKSWVGVSLGAPPQGGGGGTGKVSNVTFNGLTVHNTSRAIYVNKCYFKVPEQANYCDTSTLEFGELSFSNVSGTVYGSAGISLNCSSAAPCSNIDFQEVDLRSWKNSTVNSVCVNVGEVAGLRCNSTL